MQPILPVTVSVKKIKGAARRIHCGDFDGVARCVSTLKYITAILGDAAESTIASRGTLNATYSILHKVTMMLKHFK